MKTPYLDTEIQRLSMLESRDELTEWGKEMLNELKEIKEAVTNREVRKTNYTKILIKQDGAYALPEIRLAVIGKTAKYDFDRLTEQAYQQARDNAVKFRDDDYEYIKLFGLGIVDGIVYDCPSGFEIVIEKVKTGQRVVKTNGYPTGFEEYFKEYATLKNTK
jgi:hypothetical protein